MRVATVKQELAEHRIHWVEQCTEHLTVHASKWQTHFDSWPIRRLDGLPYEPRHAPWLWDLFEKLFKA